MVDIICVLLRAADCRAKLTLLVICQNVKHGYKCSEDLIRTIMPKINDQIMALTQGSLTDKHIPTILSFLSIDQIIINDF